MILIEFMTIIDVQFIQYVENMVFSGNMFLYGKTLFIG